MAPPSKMMSYCSLLYSRMDNEATEEENVRVWRGGLISTCKELGIPEGTYAKVVSTLRSLGCIEQVSRGYRGNTPSVFVLLFPPTEELWNVKSQPDSLTGGPTLDMLSGRLDDLSKQIGGINVVAAMANLEQRIAKLEKANRDTGT